MFARLLHICVTLAAVPVWLFGLVLPLAWLVVAAGQQVVTSTSGPSSGYVWQVKLCVSSLLIMVLASLIALTLATIASYAFARIGKLAIVWISVGVLVVPPLVYGYLWFLTLGRLVVLQSLPVPFNLPVPSLGNLALAGWAIGLWLWPIPALLLTAGWQWTGRPAWMLGRIDAGDGRAFLRAALPAMRPYIVGAAAVCLLLTAQEYAVPALFSVQTWQTQYLAMAQAGIPLGRLAISSVPPAILLLVLIVLFVRSWQSVESLGPADLGVTILRTWARLCAWTTLLLIIAMATVIPAIGSIRSLTKGLQLNTQRFHDEFVNTPIIMALAATAALAATLMALPGFGRGTPRNGYTSSYNRWAISTKNHALRSRILWTLRRWSVAQLMLTAAVIAWVLPTSLVAEAARQSQVGIMNLLDRTVPALSSLLARYDIHGPLSLLVWVSVLAGRMLPVTWLIVSLVARSLPPNLQEQAAVDGANRWQTLQRVLLPLLAPAAAAGWLICALLVATDTVTATMLQPAGFSILSVSLLNQMHYGRDGNIVAICLLMLAFAAATATAVAAALGRIARDDSG